MKDNNAEATEEQKKAKQEETEQENQSPEDSSDENREQEINDEEEKEKLSAEDQLKLEVAAWKDKYMRLHAEFDNFRKRTNKERLDLIKSAGSDVLAELLPTVDDFERAMKANESNDDIETVKEGFELIHNKLLRTLESKGLKPMNSMGEPFDTDLHEAITNVPAPTEDLKGKVVDVVEKGYYLNDKVLRYAKVVVGQ